MTCELKPEEVLHKWITSLSAKDRTKAGLTVNFTELITDWIAIGANREEVKPLMEKAIKAHLPSIPVAKNVYKKNKHSLRCSEHEYINSWCKNISDTAWQIFYSYFEIKIDKPEQIQPVKQYGSMSKEEYTLQRAYADSFPVLDPKKDRIKPMILPAEIEAILNDDSK
jgi:hypothetical protein